MLNSYLNSEKGFGLIHALVTLVIVTIAFAGLFISSIYARNQAIENYHYRVALLQATAKLELIKYYNRNSTGETNIYNIPSLYNPIILDERDGNTLFAQLDISKSTHSDLTVSTYTLYDKITIKLTWQESSTQLLYHQPDTEKTLVLREDYYRKSDIIPSP